MSRGEAARFQSTSGRAAILLAGGRGSRLGGVDKAAVVVDGRTLLDRALVAITDAGLDAIVVGPRRMDVRGVRTVREDPPFGGPAAAVVAGLAAAPAAEEVLLLAVDLPGLPGALPSLLTAAIGPDGVVAVDADGRTQWLLGRYRAAAVHGAAARRDAWEGASLRALLGDLRLASVPLPPESTRDVDTVADARAAGARLPGEEAQ